MKLSDIFIIKTKAEGKRRSLNIGVIAKRVGGGAEGGGGWLWSGQTSAGDDSILILTLFPNFHSSVLRPSHLNSTSYFTFQLMS